MSPPTLLCVILLCSASLMTPLTADDDDDDDYGKLSAYDVLKSYGFPVGLLPEGVTGYELDPNTGKFAAYLSSSCSFSISGYQLKYKPTITGIISKGKLTNLKGVSVKILLLWVNIIEVRQTGGELEFSVGIASADFPIDNFDESPKCGCGFNCVNEQVSGSLRTNPFVSSS
ncbi:Protein of unknown function DUF538 [Macleaya cordata]|uniref:DUF538 domain-containing protein n=1 Tax=Macleaya cordata TaxID=56857 RepID=A0A200PWQ5_MACCD|nr:Protein of unknown function DUF538 [Macleaya cordata]